jgi:predicted amidophosphoribosyltransferase
VHYGVTLVDYFRYCYECMNKATGERNCIVCGKKVGKNLVMCDLCPRAYHTDCLQPPLAKVKQIILVLWVPMVPYT